MDKWQKRNERLSLAEREEKLKKSKEKNKKIREATEKVENMTKKEKQNRDLEILAKVRAERERKAQEKNKQEELNKLEKDKRLKEATEKLSKWQKPSTNKYQHKSPKM
ncbi:hypothetical protein [Spiroplasma ixodetis]|uniref:Uncharacterized protein n=1 Tax=Spiroplasma ixodetis TaxID=2141 RepID=A0ABM8BZC5_9MOLU|nr:hypothetical protein [Spiroplasma ixodetis]BDT05229.1 hypothetical protein SHM_28750 [Spiroplasma ixodetis]